MERKDICSKDDVEKLFRISDEEISGTLYLLFYNAVLGAAPPDDGTESSFHSFWDDNIRKVLEMLIPYGTSIRDSNHKTSTQKLRPDYGLIIGSVCPFRGEEKPSTSKDDPKAELSYKLAWVYEPVQYVFGYYAIGPAVTLAAICAPKEPSNTPWVEDLASADLRLKRDRIAHLRRLINLAPYISSLLRVIGHHGSPEFTLIEREGKSLEIGLRSIKKTYHGDLGQKRVRMIKNIYDQLKEKGVPHVDTLTYEDSPAIYLEPRGIDIKPGNEKALLQAVTCVLQALKVLHQPPALYHRDIRWPNVLRRADDPKLWFLIDWEDAAGSNNTAADHLSPEEHSPRIFVDNHGCEVDIWGVGSLITEASAFVVNISPELLKLGMWMQDGGPSADDALIAVENYASKF